MRDNAHVSVRGHKEAALTKKPWHRDLVGARGVFQGLGWGSCAMFLQGGSNPRKVAL